MQICFRSQSQALEEKAMYKRKTTCEKHREKNDLAQSLSELALDGGVQLRWETDLE